MTDRSNLFERWDLDPGEGPAAITARLRELLEDAAPSEHEELRRAWEELTVHPRRRIEEAISTYPETRPRLGAPPRPPAAAAPPTGSAAAALVLPPVAACLGDPPPAPPSWPAIDGDPLLCDGRPRKGGAA